MDNQRPKTIFPLLNNESANHSEIFLKKCTNKNNNKKLINLIIW